MKTCGSSETRDVILVDGRKTKKSPIAGGVGGWAEVGGGCLEFKNEKK